MIKRKSTYRVEILRKEVLDKKVFSLKKEIRNVVLTCVFGGTVAMGIGGIIPEPVFASPWVDLGYGESSSNYWSVDIGSIRHNGSETTVQVELEGRYNAEGARVYHFRYNKDHWNYKYDTWSGKGDFSEGMFWEHVSSSKLANDILYIVNNH